MVKRTKEAEHLGAKTYPLTLVFIDDLMVGSGANGYRYNTGIDRLFTTSRHAGGICVLLQQQFKGLSKTARLQASHIALFPVLNDEWQSILESLAGRNGISREKLEQAYRIATAKPFGFLWLDMNAAPNDVFWSSFTKKIVPN